MDGAHTLSRAAEARASNDGNGYAKTTPSKVDIPDLRRLVTCGLVQAWSSDGDGAGRPERSESTWQEGDHLPE